MIIGSNELTGSNEPVGFNEPMGSIKLTGYKETVRSYEAMSPQGQRC